jgi:hypothetical protein
MLYEFEDEQGDRIEIDYDIGQAPPIGACVSVSGRAYKRVWSSPHVDCIDINAPMKSLPRWHPDAKRYDQKGRPIMRSQSEAREWAQKANEREGFDKWQWGEA